MTLAPPCFEFGLTFSSWKAVHTKHTFFFSLNNSIPDRSVRKGLLQNSMYLSTYSLANISLAFIFREQWFTPCKKVKLVQSEHLAVRVYQLGLSELEILVNNIFFFNVFRFQTVKNKPK